MTKRHITICICTYKRARLLNELLAKVGNQITKNPFEYSVVVVDNDECESARNVVERHAQWAKSEIKYFVETRQNISLARNKAISKAKGELIAMIDDDEVPREDWVLNLYQGLTRYNCDGILGPVLPCYEKEPPKWVLKGRFFDRPSPKSGEVLGWQNTRTGNALLKKQIFSEAGNWFNPELGSGGEDRDFFRRKIQERYVFAWCREAPVFEKIPATRWKRKVLIKRALLRGKMALIATDSKRTTILRSVVIIPIYTTCLPVLSILGHHLFMQYLVKTCDHVGKVFAFLGINVVREKYVTGK